MFATKCFLGLVTILSLMPLGLLRAAPSEGEKVFKSVCMACHTIGKGRLVGPDLKSVDKRRNDIWLKKFIKSSQSLIKSGDADAMAIFAEYNKMPMPDNALSDNQMSSLLDYIKVQSSAAPVKKAKKKKKKKAVVVTIEAEQEKPKVVVKAKISQDDIVLGQALFTGKHRFEKRGAACSSCHNVNVPGMISGGSLALDLTQAHSRMGRAGLGAIIKSSPFPAMNRAYKNKELNEDEIFAIQAFLQNANDNYAQLKPAGYGNKLFGAGIAGVLLLLGLFSAIWGNRKRDCVNQEIYDRQVKSE